MKMNVTAHLKEEMLSGKEVFACLVGGENDPVETVRGIKELGYDIVMVDCEHSLVGKETIFAYIRAAKEGGLSIWVRPEHKSSILGSLVDSGVCGFMIPQVDGREDAARAARQVYFPPLGHRGCGNWANPYLLDGQDPAQIPFLAATEYMNRNVTVFPQVEKVEAIGNLPSILRVEGVTGVVVGAFDLALDMGGIDPRSVRQQIVLTESVEARLRQISKACGEAGKVPGIGGIPPRDCGRWAKEGYRLFILGYLMGGGTEELSPLIREARASLQGKG